VFPELIILRHLFAVLHGRWEALRADPEAGYSTEAVIVTALLAALALTAEPVARTPEAICEVPGSARVRSTT